MTSSAVVITLAVLSAADAGYLVQRPFGYRVPAGYLLVPIGGVASGSADGAIRSSVYDTALGRTRVDSVGSQAGGQTSGLGSSSVNRANAGFSRTDGLLGASQTSNVNANSVQNTVGVPFAPASGVFQPQTFQPGSNVLPGQAFQQAGNVFPGQAYQPAGNVFPGQAYQPAGNVFPGQAFQPALLPVNGAASGNAGGLVNVRESQGPGGFSRETSVSASAGGSASNGGSSTNTANASHSRTQTAFGASETSNTGANSVQTSRR